MSKYLWLVWCALALVVGCTNSPPPRATSGSGEEARRLADQNAFEAHGYAQASERFLQMDILRRAVSGRLAELFGATKLEHDQRSYSLGLPQIIPSMEKKLATERPETYELVRAYTRGVNKFLEQVAHSAPGTPLHGLLDAYRAQIAHDPKYVPATWEVADSLAANLALSYGLTNALEETLALGVIFQKAFAEQGHPEKFVDFLDARPIEPFQPLPHHAETVPADSRTLAKEPGALPMYSCREFDFPFGCARPAPGSNTWAVSGKLLSAKSKASALLASDPHLPLQTPSFYYETTIDSAKDGGSFNVTGESIPGIPGIAIGHNDRIAWGVTNSMAHVDQVYVETLDADGRRVKFQDRWVRLTENTYSIAVREPNGALRTEKITVRTVPHHGPLFSEHWKQIREMAPGLSLSYRWVGLEDGGTLDAAATIEMNRARNFSEFKAAVALNGTSAGNYLYADTAGNIGYTQHGRYPIRANVSAALPPYIPLPGDGRFEWTGYRTVFPESYNPPENYLVVVNDDPWGRNLEKHFGEFKDYFTFKSTDGCRGKRIRDLLTAKGKGLTVADMKRIQFDHKDLLAYRLVNEVLRPLNKKGLLGDSAAGKLLMGWNAEMARQRPEPLVYAAWLYVMMAKHFAATIPLGVFPVIGETPAGVQTLYHQLKAKLASDPTGTAKWIQATLAEAEKSLKESKRWGNTWGSEHRLTLKNALGPTQPGVERDGSWLTVDVGGYQGIAKPDGSLPSAFSNTYGANFRMVSELRKNGAIETVAVVPGGGVTGDEKRYSEGAYREVRPLLVTAPRGAITAKGDR